MPITFWDWYIGQFSLTSYSIHFNSDDSSLSISPETQLLPVTRSQNKP